MARSVRKAPDGGWGWVIVLASFLLQALSVGNMYSFGIIYVELLNYFNESQSTTAWIGSLQAGLLYMVCVLAGPPLKKLGWRIVTIMGASFSATGFFLCSLAPNIYVLFLTYGAMTGAGFGALYISSLVTVQHFFDKHRSLATGITVSGSGVGTMVFGFLTRMLLDKYHWRTTVIIEGGITLVVGLFCGSLLRPLPKCEDEEESQPILKQPSCYEAIETAPNYESLSSKIATSKSSLDTLEYLVNNNPHVEVLNDAKKHKRPSPAVPHSCEAHTRGGKCICCCNPGCHDVFHLRLLKNPLQIIVCLTMICFCFGYHVPYMFTPERAKEMFNIDSSHCSLLVSIMGMTNVVSRVVCGWIGDHGEKIRFWMLGMGIIACGLINTLVFLFATYTMLVVYCVVFGICTGCVGSMLAVVLVDLMGISDIEYTLGLSLASASSTFMVASPTAGWIIQYTGSYDMAFLAAGVVQIIGGLIFCTISLVRKRWPKYRHPLETEEQQTPKSETKNLLSDTVA